MVHPTATAALLVISLQASAESPALEDIVHPIVTTHLYSNGGIQRNRGHGFVVGDRFYTAYHNLSGAGTSMRHRTELGGITVEPDVVDVIHDLAMFRVPPQLCGRWCNDLELVAASSIGAVVWITKEGHRRSGNVTNVAFKTARVDASPDCDDNLVVEIDQPFVPGSSGGPVFDAATGAVVGLIQGSFQDAEDSLTGYFKPVECVLARLEPERIRRSSGGNVSY